MRIEWDETKARTNFKKHGISFYEASSVFYDQLSATGEDGHHSIDEKRFVTFGLSSSGHVLAVFHTERGDAVRIISARKATRAERKLYEQA